MIIRDFCKIPQVVTVPALHDQFCEGLIPKNKQAFSEGGTKC